MALETATYISDLIPTNPVGATDKKKFGDDHLRMLKAVLQNQFPSLGAAAVNATAAELSRLSGSQDFMSTFLSAATINAARAALDINIIGEVKDFAGTVAPAGWLECYGQEISRVVYADLFAVVSTTYGVGDGSTTFNLPDLRGRIVVGKDNMGGTSAERLTAQSGGVDGDTLGAVGGAETHTLTSTQMPVHAHGVSDPGHYHQEWYGAEGGAKRSAAHNTNSGNVINSTPRATGISIQNAGGGAAHNNVQPSIVLLKIIKY